MNNPSRFTYTFTKFVQMARILAAFIVDAARQEEHYHGQHNPEEG
jgi:hypothetical protein